MPTQVESGAGRGSWGVVVFALFLMAGSFKADGRLASMPVDFTVATAAVVLLVVIAGFSRGRGLAGIFHGGLVLASFATFIPATIWMPTDPAAIQKATRLFTLTACAALAPMVLVERERDLRRLLLVLAGLGVVVAVGGLPDLLDGSGDGSRLSPFGANPISVGRATGGAIIVVTAFGVVGERPPPRRFALGVLVVLGLLAVALGSGSRGPIVSLVVALGWLGVTEATGRSRVAGRVVVGVGVVALCIPTLIELLPSTTSSRLGAAFGHGELGTSGHERVHLWRAAQAVVFERPGGLGWGGFAVHLDRAEAYPHNVIVELAVEAGLWAAACFVLVLVIVLVRATRAARRHPGSPSFACVPAMLVYWLGCASFSGDVNDNKSLFAWLTLAATSVGLQTVADRVEPVAVGETGS